MRGVRFVLVLACFSLSAVTVSADDRSAIEALVKKGEVIEAERYCLQQTGDRKTHATKSLLTHA